MLSKILELIKNKKQSTIIIAIDGRCASGKSTIGSRLQTDLKAELIHMDDFFLRDVQKTKERLNEIGGNIDYERFLSEVLLPLKKGLPIIYRPYNCSLRDFENQVIVKKNKIIIIEGSYSHHPKFQEFIDLKIFVTVNEDEQLERIRERNSSKLLQRFIDEWIPLEEKYFVEFKIKESAEVIIDTSSYS